MRFEFRHVPLVLARVTALGGRADDLTAQVGISAAEAAQPVVVGSAERIEALLAEASRRTGCGSFGLDVATHVPRGRFGWLEFGMRTAPTFGEGLELLATYSALINRDAGYAYVLRAEDEVLGYETPRRPGGLGPQLNEFTIALVLALTQQAAARPWSPRRVWFAHAAPTSEAVAAHFGCSLGFSEGTSGFAFDRDLALEALPTHDPALHALLRSRLQDLLPAADASRSATARVRTEILRRMGRDPIALDDVARGLATSSRTLQRELGAEGTTFADLVDTARRELATRLLERHELTLGEIASLLGYADLRGFERAFHRWAGVTPGRWRLQHPA